MAKMTGGKAVLESLKAHGVDTLFGIISVHNLDLYDALFDQEDSFRYIGGRMEKLGCGFMADGYSRVSGKPGVLITSTGPGAADSITRALWARPTTPPAPSSKSLPTSRGSS